MSVVGRTQDYLLTASGAHVPTTALNLENKEIYVGLVQIQYVQQESRDKILVRIVVTEDWTEAKTRILAEALTAHLPGCSVTVTRVRSVETAPNGKAPIVIRTVN